MVKPLIFCFCNISYLQQTVYRQSTDRQTVYSIPLCFNCFSRVLWSLLLFNLNYIAWRHRREKRFDSISLLSEMQYIGILKGKILLRGGGWMVTDVWLAYWVKPASFPKFSYPLSYCESVNRKRDPLKKRLNLNRKRCFHSN